MATPNNMPRLSVAVEREHRAWRAEIARERRLNEIAEAGGDVTASKAYKLALRKVGVK